MPNGTAEEWEAGWRKNVNDRLSSFDGKLDSMLSAIQGLVTRMTVNEGAIAEMRQEKQAAPRLAQGRSELTLMLVFGAITILCNAGGWLMGLGSLLLGLANLLMAHWH